LDVSSFIEKRVRGTPLTSEEAYALAMGMARNELDDAQKAGVLVSLRCGNEKSEEVVGFARALLELAVKVGPFRDALDTAGTGGDRANLFNVSTATAITLAAMGYKVVKHGNRSVTGISGSADILEALGFNINLEPSKVKEMYERVGFAFIFAPLYHPAMKNVAPVRKSLGIRTIFNMVGPLSNPARPGYQLVGVSEPWMLEVLARALRELGVRRAAVVHGRPGIDEVSPVSSTDVYLVDEDGITYTNLDVSDFGATPLESLEPLRVASLEEAKDKFLRALAGEYPEAVFLGVNAAMAIHVLEGIDVSEAYLRVTTTLAKGEAIQKLREVIEASGGTPKF